MFESVTNRHTHGRTDRRRLDSYTISSPFEPSDQVSLKVPIQNVAISAANCYPVCYPVHIFKTSKDKQRNLLKRESFMLNTGLHHYAIFGVYRKRP